MAVSYAKTFPCSECGSRTRGFGVTNAPDLETAQRDYNYCLSGFHYCQACARERATRQNRENQPGDPSFHIIRF